MNTYHSAIPSLVRKADAISDYRVGVAFGRLSTDYPYKQARREAANRHGGIAPDSFEDYCEFVFNKLPTVR